MGLPGNIHEIILARLTGEIEPGQELEFQAWLRESESNYRVYRDFCALWYSGRWENKREGVDRSKGWKQVDRKYQKRKYFRLFTRIAVASSVILIIGIFWIYRTGKDPEKIEGSESVWKRAEVTLILSSGDSVKVKGMRGVEIQEEGVVIRPDSSCLEYRGSEMAELGEVFYNELIIPKCGEYRLRLADGSLVIMNSESRLRFPVEFSGDKREVYLEGEACFEVMKDTGKPFVVHTARADVLVLGTLFNVSAYVGEINTEITLVEGRVQMNVNGVERKLEPGQQFVLNNETSKVMVREVEALNYIAWTDGLFRFDAMPLGQLMERLGRWYDITYEFKDASLRDVRFTGGFRKYDDIRHIVGMIGEITDVIFEVNGNKVIINNK